jgi:hypothetical protein
MKSRVPDDLNDERAVKTFLDTLDRKNVKLADLADLAASPTVEQISTKINAMLAIFRLR